MELATIKTKILSEISDLVNDGAKIAKIDNAMQYENAAKLMKSVATKAMELDRERLETTKPLRDEVEQINSAYAEFIDRLKSLTSNIKNVLVKYDKEQEQKRLEEQRKRDEEARKQREKIEAEARAQREKEEAERRKAEEARRAEEESRRKAAEEQDAERRKILEAEAITKRKEAEKAESKAETYAEKADLKEIVASSVVSQVVVSEKKSAVSQIKTYKIEVQDKRKVIQWLLDNTMMDGTAYILLDEGALNRLAQSAKGNIKIAGGFVVESITERRK